MAVKNPLVTVVLPVYNGSRTLRRSVRSVLAQTLAEIEIVCVDDASTDGTVRKLEKLCIRNPQIRMLSLEKNSGPLAARLAGVRAAKGDYIAFLDCGDRIVKDGLQQLLLAATSTDADVTVGASSLVAPHLCKISYSRPRTAFEDYRFTEESEVADNVLIYKGMLNGSLSASIWDKVYRRAWLVRHLPEAVDFRVGEDYYFVASVMAYASKVHFTDADYYEWTYSGLAEKYFMKGFSENAALMGYVLDTVSGHAPGCGLDPDEAREAVAGKFLYQTMLGLSEYYRRCHSRKKTVAFAREMFRHPVLERAKGCVKSFKNVCSDDLTPEVMVDLAGEHLHRHRKYYIFTRILNLIYRK